MATSSIAPAPEVLHSWKEIARYLDRGVRTVQRWEVELALPVKRPHDAGRSTVFALRLDLDSWVHSCPVVRHTESTKVKPEETKNSGYNPDIVFDTGKLILESRRIRCDTRESRAQLNVAVHRLRQTMGRMLVRPPARA